MKKKILCSLLALLVLNLSFPHVTWVADPIDGYCWAEGNEDDVTWEFDGFGLLTISGSGKMGDYGNGRPWDACMDEITTVVIERGVTSIGDFAFSGCSNLTSVDIPDSVESIGEEAFSDCTSLETVDIPARVTSIGGDAFGGTPWLASEQERQNHLVIVNNILIDGTTARGNVVIPKRVTSIADRAFKNCCDLTSVAIPDRVSSIGGSAFEDCTSLEKVDIPARATSIGARAFANTPWLSAQQRGNRGLVTINNILIDGTTASGDVVIPNGVTSIGDGAFDGCTNLTSVTIPGSVTIIGDSAFIGCTNLTSVTIPGSVIFIGYYAFFACTSLRTLFYKEWLNLSNAGVPSETAKIAYTVNSEQNSPGKTEVKLLATSGQINIKCDAMGENYKITDVVDGITLGHTWDAGTVEAPTADKLGGTKYTCTSCGYEYWTGCLTGNMSSQTLMPNGETIYEYCKRNDLLVEKTVDVGDGKTLKVLLMDPLGELKQDQSDELGIEVTYIKEGTERYNELMSQVDDDHPIEHINFFEVYPTVNGERKEGELTKNVYMAYEIPEGWDISDLEMILVKDGDDQEFDEKVIEINGKKYLAMWKDHFSPYAMIDKLTDEEKAALVAKTGDNSRSIILASSAMLIIIGLFLEVCMKKKAKYR